MLNHFNHYAIWITDIQGLICGISILKFCCDNLNKQADTHTQAHEMKERLLTSPLNLN